MIIHVYSIMHNEEFLLLYFLRHYETFADKIFIIDDHSTDKTVEIAKANPKVKILKYKYKQGLVEQDFNRTFKYYSDKYSRGVADWVICVDADEFILNPDIRKKMRKMKQYGFKALRTTAYTMLSDHLPKKQGQIYDELQYGVRSLGFDKPCIFNPEIDIEFGDGRHRLFTKENINPGKSKLALLHYRYLSRDWAIERSNRAFERMNLSDKTKSKRIAMASSFYDENIKLVEKVI